MNNTADLTAALVRRRLQLGLTQQQVAHRIGCHPTQVSRWEGRRLDPTVESLSEWATALGCDLLVVPQQAGSWRAAA